MVTIDEFEKEKQTQSYTRGELERKISHKIYHEFQHCSVPFGKVPFRCTLDLHRFKNYEFTELSSYNVLKVCADCGLAELYGIFPCMMESYEYQHNLGYIDLCALRAMEDYSGVTQATHVDSRVGFKIFAAVLAVGFIMLIAGVTSGSGLLFIAGLACLILPIFVGIPIVILISCGSDGGGNDNF